MNIGFIEDTHLHGGTQIWVTEAVRAFIERGQEVTLLAPENSWVVEQCANTGAFISTYDWEKVVKEEIREQEIWTAALSRCDVAVCTVHPPRDGFHCSVFAARCIKEANLATHLIPKTGTIVPEYKREFYLPDETINSSVITIADFTRQYLIDTYRIPPDKTALIYQGTDTVRFQHSEVAQTEAHLRYPLPEKASPIIGSIGSFEHRKGHPVLFEALQDLAQDSLPNIHLMMVGDGPDESMLRNLMRDLNLEKNITFFPFTSEPEFVFERLDLTVLPSLFKEGLPNVLLESMSMGVPVVSSAIGGVGEIVIDGETGFMVEPGDKTGLSDAIQNLWQDQDRYRKMVLNTRELISGEFNKNLQFDRFISYFHAQKSAD